MQDISVRIAEKKDWKIVQRLNAEVFEDNATYDDDLDLDFPYSRVGEEYYQAAVSSPDHVCFLAEIKGEVVGYLAAEEQKIDYRKSRYVELANMGVSPQFRSQGIGEQLIQALLDWAKDHGYDRIFVSAYASNTKAIVFYQKNGFREIGVELERKI